MEIEQLVLSLSLMTACAAAAIRHHNSTADAAPDRIDRLAAGCPVVDLNRSMRFEEFLEIAIASLAMHSNVDRSLLADAFLKQERIGCSVIAPGIAVSHVIVRGVNQYHLVVARGRGGVRFPGFDEAVHGIFFILRSEDERSSHLRALSAIAQIVQDPAFEEQWAMASDSGEIRRILLSTMKRRRKFSVAQNRPGGVGRVDVKL